MRLGVVDHVEVPAPASDPEIREAMLEILASRKDEIVAPCRRMHLPVAPHIILKLRNCRGRAKGESSLAVEIHPRTDEEKTVSRLRATGGHSRKKRGQINHVRVREHEQVCLGSLRRDLEHRANRGQSVLRAFDIEHHLGPGFCDRVRLARNRPEHEDTANLRTTTPTPQGVRLMGGGQPGKGLRGGEEIDRQHHGFLIRPQGERAGYSGRRHPPP